MPNPFGIQMGDTPSAEIANYFVRFRSVPHPHPAFINYSGTWSPDGGLEMITATSRQFQDDSMAYASRELYGIVRQQLERVYGPYHNAEFIEVRGTWIDPDDFCQGLISGERVHMSLWEARHGSRLDANIFRIILSIDGVDSETSTVALSYEFANSQKDGKVDELGMGSL